MHAAKSRYPSDQLSPWGCMGCGLYSLEKGYGFYKENFISKERLPKFYNNRIHPIDCTAGSQTILTTTKFGDRDIAHDVALNLIKTMQKGDGSFRFRRFKHHSINTSFMRWSNAWMFAAFCYLKSNLS